MGLAKTLLKVAIGVAVAKGVSTLVKGAGAGSGVSTSAARPRGIEDIMDGIGGQNSGAGTSRRFDPQEQDGAGGLGGLLGQLTGQKPSAPRGRTNAPRGGLEDLLGGGGSQGGGGLGDLLGQLTGGASPRATAPSGGGLGDLLGQLTGGGAAQTTAPSGGGLGDLLGQLTGQGSASRAPTQSGGGLGDLLGAVLGGMAGVSAGGAAPQASPRQQDLAAALILRAMVAAVKADGKLDDDERQKLTQQLDGASREEVAFIQAELQRNTDVDELASQVPEGMETQVYVMSLMAIDLDNQKEAQYLDRLANALALTHPEVNALHDHAGVQRLYR